jgi:copper chaperone CopZ
MDSTTLKIGGMTCDHCSATVTKALEKVSGVRSAQVDLANGEAVVTGAAAVQSLIQAVKEEGYEAEVKRG